MSRLPSLEVQCITLCPDVNHTVYNLFTVQRTVYKTEKVYRNTHSVKKATMFISPYTHSRTQHTLLLFYIVTVQLLRSSFLSKEADSAKWR
jgi:hypothetical protein